MQWYSLIQLLTTHKYKSNTQPVNSSTHFVCSHTVYCTSRLWLKCGTHLVSLQSPFQVPQLKISTPNKSQLKLEMQTGKNVLEKRSFGKILLVFPLQSELKNTSGFENVAKRNSKRQLIEVEAIQCSYMHLSTCICLLCIYLQVLPFFWAGIEKHTKPSTKSGSV